MLKCATWQYKIYCVTLGIEEENLMITHGKNIKIFTGNAHPQLASDIANILGVSVGKAKVGTFSDGEISVDISETVRGADVFLVQSTNAPVNDNLMELLIMMDAFKRASAGRITAVMPYYGYARQDRKAKSRDPITAKLVADLITAAGADRVLSMDLHAAQIQGYFNIPLDNLMGAPLLSKYFISKGFADDEDVVVVSPDLGSVSRSRKFADKLHAPIAIIDKRRPRANVCEIMNIIGDVKGKTAILVDDMIDTAGTIANAANALVDLGAKEVYACCSHGVLSGPAVERLQNSAIKELVMLNTINLPKEKQIDKFKYISVAPIFAEAIKRIYEDVSISKLFD
jgi:ribose-phosphate pyrophosphokinase